MKAGLDRHHLSHRGSSPSRRGHVDSARTREAGEGSSGRDVPTAMGPKHWLLGYEWMDRGPAWNGHGEEDPASSSALARIGTRVRARTFGRPGRGLEPAPHALVAVMTGGFHFGTGELSRRRQENRPRHGRVAAGTGPACSSRRDGGDGRKRIGCGWNMSLAPSARIGTLTGALSSGGTHPHSSASTCAAESMAMQLVPSSGTAGIGCRVTSADDRPGWTSNIACCEPVYCGCRGTVFRGGANMGKGLTSRSVEARFPSSSLVGCIVMHLLPLQVMLWSLRMSVAARSCGPVKIRSWMIDPVDRCSSGLGWHNAPRNGRMEWPLPRSLGPLINMMADGLERGVERPLKQGTMDACGGNSSRCDQAFNSSP